MRHVAGELRLAGLIPPQLMPSILERLNSPLPSQPCVEPEFRPPEVERPLLPKDASWSEEERIWVDEVVSDVKPWVTKLDEYILAEVTFSEIHQARQAGYRLWRIRAPKLENEIGDFEQSYRNLPAALWLGKTIPLDEELSPNLIRRFVSSFSQEAPKHPIALCPNWMRHLGWKLHQDDPYLYLGSDSMAVARIGFWRDAGPADIEDNFMWGEGSYFAVTGTGLSQIKALYGTIDILAFATREVKKSRKDGERIVRSSRSSYLI